jgi:predicted ATPase/transcriptional regulator with XRE-family HTH domain
MMDYSFGNWVKRRRKSLDLTQQGLAERVGCSLATIVKIESDERRPSRQIAELLAQCLEIPPDQREQFLKVARRDKTIESLEAIAESEAPPPAQPVHSTYHIPHSPGSLIGREFELTEIVRLVQDPRCRLLTLTGQGGIGKTHLSIHTASLLAEGKQAPVAFVGLAPVSGRDQVVTAIADALKIVLYTAADRSTQLISYLHDRELILFLDNFEHLAPDPVCVDLISDILRGTHSVKLVITSRQPLQLQAEWVFAVQGLPVPKQSQLEELETSSAVRLFLQRAEQASSGFELTEANHAAVRQICQLVDGVPLAIELAASWVRVLTPAEIAHEIQSNIDFLTTTSRDITERHRSIRATFDYSWKLLSAEEQLALQRLSIFKGGFTRAAAEQVAGASLSLLSSLVAKSLLQRTDTGRYDVHELVRQYSFEHLQADKTRLMDTHDRYSDYYSSLLQRAGALFKGVDQPTAAAELAAELSNLRQAWRWAGETGQVMHIGQAVDTLFWLYESRCDCREGVPLFGYVANCMGKTNGPKTRTASGVEEMRDVTRARVMAYQGFFLLRQGQHPQARELLLNSLNILRPLSVAGVSDARDAMGYTLAFLGMVTAALGDYENGSSHLHEGLQIKRENNDRWGIAFCLRQLGLLAYYQGAYEESHLLLSESLDVSRELGNAWATAYSLDFLSTAAYARGDYEEAEKLLNEGLSLSQSVGDRFTTAYGLNGLSQVKKALGSHAEAQHLLEKSIAIWREIGDQASLAQSLNMMGDVLLGTNEWQDARSYFREALSVARSAQMVPVMLDALLGEATLRARAGLHDQILKVTAYIKDHPSSTQTTKSRASELHMELVQKLPAEKLGALHAVAEKAEIDLLIEDVLWRQNTN